MSQPAQPPESGSARSGRRMNTTPSSLEHVSKLAEVLTAIGNYLEAAIRLEATDTRSARMRLREALQKGHAQLLQADEILRRLRDLLRDKGAAADK